MKSKSFIILLFFFSNYLISASDSINVDSLIDQLIKEPCRSILKTDTCRIANWKNLKSIRKKSTVIATIYQNINKLIVGTLKNDSTLYGYIIVRLSIDEKGNVINCESVNSNIKDNSFIEDFLTEIKKWKFTTIDSIKDTSIIEYPFILSP